MMDTVYAFISKIVMILGHLRYVLFGLGDDVDSWLYSMSVLDDMKSSVSSSVIAGNILSGHGEKYILSLYVMDDHQ